MGLSRRMDVGSKQALPDGTVTAPQRIRDALGACRECGSTISTHGYELCVETASSENPSFEEKAFASVVLCEKCYHRFSERGFWLNTVKEFGCVVNVIGLALLVAAIFWLKSEVLGAIGAIFLVFPSLARVPARQALERRNEKFLLRHFPEVGQAKHVNIVLPWWQNSVLLAVPSALAVLVHTERSVPQLSTDDLQRIVSGDVRSWSEVGGGDGNISLYLPIGQWREWSVVKGQLLQGGEPGPNVALKSPIDLLQKLGEDRNGIGFLPLTVQEFFGEGVRVLDVDGEECDPKNDNYPLWVIPPGYPAADLPTSEDHVET